MDQQEFQPSERKNKFINIPVQQYDIRPIDEKEEHQNSSIFGDDLSDSNNANL